MSKLKTVPELGVGVDGEIFREHVRPAIAQAKARSRSLTIR
jgi:hypothetical protein